ncbi:hypothetical protein WM40_05195 [Robbsia andropogonis]|uniref:Transposase IS4-like domain-containing protein n=1 Tax=Robbsia andropogonis TaxID=28092 RepID=A0A0F5K2N2_9BURK|nr:hypothetical protein WM40_05195 [Robbsia andropogonis]
MQKMNVSALPTSRPREMGGLEGAYPKGKVGVRANFISQFGKRTKASIRAKFEHPFRLIKQQFGFVNVRYRGLKKNTAQLATLFALSNLWMTRRKLIKV